MIPQSLVSFKEAISSDHPATASESDTSTYTLDPEDDDSYYTVSHGRRIQTENNIYLLPYDSEYAFIHQLLEDVDY
jgi:spore germination protein GerM